jgi:hypothetical protein
LQKCPQKIELSRRQRYLVSIGVENAPSVDLRSKSLEQIGQLCRLGLPPRRAAQNGANATDELAKLATPI